MSKTILVTGGAGYIGSHACKALARAGYEPVSYDSLMRGHREASVMHFAAFAYVEESVREPALYFRNNVINTFGLFEAMREADVARIVFSSTCATYGVPERVPISEDTPQRPVNPYGEGKLMVERALHWLDAAHGLRYASLRYFNAAGADPDGEIGED